ncbi:small archaeal modifier protein 2 [Halobacteriales archaeon QS_9_67_17]|nr:MAG: small archaeal modifier protein 2 [Halobacteriales archaeon QS_9_67_17]
MKVTCEVVGEGVEECELPADAAYDDLLAELGFSRHEATVLVDGAPVPADATVATDAVRVLRLIRGG